MRRRLRALSDHAVRGVVLAIGWAVLCVPVLTWVAATAAVMHSLDRAGRPGDAVPELWDGWRRHWRRGVPLGAVSLLLLAALLMNLLFLTGQAGAPAFLLLVGTLVLLVLWAMAVLTVVPLLVLAPDLPTGRLVRTGLALALRHPVPGAGLALGTMLLLTGLAQVWVPLAVLAVPAVAWSALALARRHLPPAP